MMGRDHTIAVNVTRLTNQILKDKSGYILGIDHINAANVTRLSHKTTILKVIFFTLGSSHFKAVDEAKYFFVIVIVIFLVI